MNLQTNQPTPAAVLRSEQTSREDTGGLVAEPSRYRTVMAGLVQLVLVLALLGAAWMVRSAILNSSPTAERGARERVARLVEVVSAVRAQQGPLITAWGNVQAAQTLIVRPEIAGTLEWVHPDVAPGGILAAGTEVARLDDRDLRLAIERAEADIADIEARILLERGQAAIGERELTRLSRNITAVQRSLVLREPQMAQLEAELAAARASLTQAENALERTIVIAPFDALVLSENVAPGTMLSAGMEAATLAQADRFEVILKVSARNLEWIVLDGTQQVTLTQPGVWPEGASRMGTVTRLGAGLSDTGRMVELVVEVQDPLSREAANIGQPRLLLGSFLRGTVRGAPVRDANAVRIERAHLRDDDTVWVVNADEQLEIRQLEIVWRGPDAVLATGGVQPGERIITTPLAVFAPGLAVRTERAE